MTIGRSANLLLFAAQPAAWIKELGMSFQSLKRRSDRRPTTGVSNMLRANRIVVSAVLLALSATISMAQDGDVSSCCPPVDLVFMMDTSGSMDNEAEALCLRFQEVLDSLAAQAIAVNPTLLGITADGDDDSDFPCLTDNVRDLLGAEVPGSSSCGSFLGEEDSSEADEEWGPGTAIVADRFPWTPGAVRLIVPISDEGPCAGDDCFDPGSDRDAITNAIAIASANGVIVSPITGAGSSACVITLAQALAAGTGGTAFESTDPNADLPGGIRDIVLQACELFSDCNDNCIIRWNRQSGDFNVETNWDPEQVPSFDQATQRGDTAVFPSTGLPYIVTGQGIQVGAMRFLEQSEVSLVGQVELKTEFPACPQLLIERTGALSLSNVGTELRASEDVEVDGLLLVRDQAQLFSNTAQVGGQVSVSGALSRWETQALTIGADAAGEVLVDDLATLRSEGPIVLGGLEQGTLKIESGGLVAAPVIRVEQDTGSALIEVRNDSPGGPSQLNADSIVLLGSNSASMVIEDGGQVSVQEAFLGKTNKVTISGEGIAGTRSTLSVTQGSLEVVGAKVEVNDGALLETKGPTVLANSGVNAAQIRVNNTALGLPPFGTAERSGAAWKAEGPVSIHGAAGEPSELLVEDGGVVRMGLGAPLAVGDDFGDGRVIVSGAGSLLVSFTDLFVGGTRGRGTLTLSDGAVVAIHRGVIGGGTAGEDPQIGRGDVRVEGGLSPAKLQVLTDLEVGTGEANGSLFLFTNLPFALGGPTVEVLGELKVGLKGIVLGNGTLRAPNRNVLNGGFIEPGLSPGMIVIEGGYEQLPEGVLVMEAAGLAPEQRDLLKITGSANLSGTLEVHFLDGFLPKRGDAFDFIQADGGITGQFAQVVFPDVAPGFEADVRITPEGKLILTALNDAGGAGQDGDDAPEGQFNSECCGGGLPALLPLMLLGWTRKKRVTRRISVLCVVSIAMTLGTAASAAVAAVPMRTVALSGRPAPGTGAGISFSGFELPAIDASGQAAFGASLTGLFVPAFSDSGIWSEGAGALTLVAREGGAAPGTPNGVRFSEFDFDSLVFNGAGQTAFAASLAGSGVDDSNDGGIWSEGGGALARVAREGSAVPGALAGVTYLDLGFDSLVFNDAGQTAFAALIFRSDLGLDRRCIFSEGSGDLKAIACEGNPAPGTEFGVSFSNFGSPMLNGAGGTAFSAFLTGPGVNASNNTGIWIESPPEESTGLTLIAREGGPAPGTAEEVRFSSITSPVLNDAGQTAFRAFLTGAGVNDTNDRGIWSQGPGVLTLIAREGTPAPGTAADFLSLGAPVLNGAGQTAFRATLFGTDQPDTNSGIWSEGRGALTLLAFGANPAPGTPAGVQFLDFDPPVLNGAGRTAFFASLRGSAVTAGINDKAIFAEVGEDGALVLVARTGETLEVAPGDVRQISNLGFIGGGGLEDGRQAAFNDAGQLAFRAEFIDGSEGIFITLDPDLDDDGVNNAIDNCPNDGNADQADADADGTGDACDECADDPAKIRAGVCGCGAPDLDADGDGITDCIDVCPNDAGDDFDFDGVCNGDDNCLNVANAGQEDADGDGVGDACDDSPTGDEPPLGQDIDGAEPPAGQDGGGDDAPEGQINSECCGGGLPVLFPLMLLGWRRARSSINSDLIESGTQKQGQVIGMARADITPERADPASAHCQRRSAPETGENVLLKSGP